MDPRVRELAKNLIKNSVCLKKGDRVLIRGIDNESFKLVEALMDEAYRVGNLI